LTKGEDRICVITHGDVANDVRKTLANPEILKCKALVCCSHVRDSNNSTFRVIHDWVRNFLSNHGGLEKNKVFPLFKNMLADYGNNDIENNYTTDLIIRIITSSSLYLS